MDKLSSILQALELGDPKAALKILEKDIEKSQKKANKDPYVKVTTSLIRATILAANKQQRECNVAIESAFTDLSAACENAKQIKLADLLDLIKPI